MNEVEWLHTEVAPLLRRIGFTRVTVTHGVDEKGRDLVFAELDRFGLLRYFAAQTKRTRIDAAGGGRAFEELIAQLTSAYKYPYKDPATGTVHRMAGVYLITAGDITPQARERLSEHVGQSLYFVDASQLEIARQLRVAVSDEERHARLTLLLRELRVAEDLLGVLRDDIVTYRRTGTLAVATVDFPTRHLESALDVLWAELDEGDVAVLTSLFNWLHSTNRLMSRMPLGSGASRAMGFAVGSCERVVPEAQAKARATRHIVEYAIARDRPLPGARLGLAPRDAG